MPGLIQYHAIMNPRNKLNFVLNLVMPCPAEIYSQIQLPELNWIPPIDVAVLRSLNQLMLFAIPDVK